MARRDLFRSARDRADQSATSVWGLLMFPEQTSERGKIAAKKRLRGHLGRDAPVSLLEAFELRMVEVGDCTMPAPDGQSRTEMLLTWSMGQK